MKPKSKTWKRSNSNPQIAKLKINSHKNLINAEPLKENKLSKCDSSRYHNNEFDHKLNKTTSKLLRTNSSIQGKKLFFKNAKLTFNQLPKIQSEKKQNANNELPHVNIPLKSKSVSNLRIIKNKNPNSQIIFKNNNKEEKENLTELKGKVNLLKGKMLKIKDKINSNNYDVPNLITLNKKRELSLRNLSNEISKVNIKSDINDKIFHFNYNKQLHPSINSFRQLNKTKLKPDQIIDKKDTHSYDKDTKSKNNKILSENEKIKEEKKEKKYYIAKREILNHKIVKKYSKKTQAGKTERSNTKTNQDSILINYQINGIENFNMFGILDGHGLNGHLVSQFVTKYIKKSFEEIPMLKDLKTVDDIYFKLKENHYLIIKQIFSNAENQLKLCDFDCSFSGTTCVIVIQLGYNIICANTGDSRAIIARRSESESINKLEIVPLSKDHKPNLEREKKRIIRFGGRVEQFSEFGIKAGPYRVWLKKEMYPGLAMSRSIGDLVASSVGVISEPEIIETNINWGSKFIIIGSDGVWEFLENSRVVQIVNGYYNMKNPEGACDAIVEESTKMWRQQDIVIDDISVVVVFF